MGFSVTGNLLSGSVQRPDMVTLLLIPQIETIYIAGGLLEGRKGEIREESFPCLLNALGYLPVVSTISGLSRALLGIVHTIVHLVCSIFPKNREHHFQEASLGAKNIGRGLIEAIPVIGNIILILIDFRRKEKFKEMALNHVHQSPEVYSNHAAMFIYGQEIARRPLAEYEAEIEALGKKPSQKELERIIRGA